MLALLLAAELLVFQGNIALVDGVYKAALDLPASTTATPANARSVAFRVRRFLHKAGYPLSFATARVQGQQIVVQIDEGRLDKVIFVGGGAFETLRLRLDLHLHDDVFNQPELERQLKGLAARLGLADFAYEIVPVEGAPPRGLQLDDIEPLEEATLGLVRTGRPYELHILVQPGVFHPGISPELEIDSLEGGGLGATYNSGRLFLEEDRFRISGRAAGALVEKLDHSASKFGFTRAVGEGSYAAPPIWQLRPALRGRIDVSNRQRSDLRLESFMFATLEAGVEVVWAPVDQFHARLGSGVERRLLWGLEPVTGETLTPGVPTSIAQNRPYGELAVDVVFDPRAVRRDQHHTLALSARVYSAPSPVAEGAVHLSGHYQKHIALGWDELWVESIGFARSGGVLFPEETSIGGDPLRGPFGSDYARRLGALQLEYRFSLLRDVFKLGVFHNFVAYGRLDRVAQTETPAFANSFGLGVHALLIDAFQLDLWIGQGFSSDGRSDRGGALAIRQAF